jgi:hypothetical protein
MKRPHIRPASLIPRLFAVISIAWLALLALPAGAFPIGAPGTVVEFYNTFLGHYFMTMNEAEIADIDGGKAGPGWVRTGYGFTAFPSPPPAVGTCILAAECAPLLDVRRFYSRLSNSHFFTIDAAEAAGLVDNPLSEWKFEAVEFTIPAPHADGQCGLGLTPVYRLYNGRFAFNDSNHRFVTSQAERERMRALGWLDEGVRFCAFRAVEEPIRAFSIRPLEGPFEVRPSAQCEDESINIGPCIAVNNLPTPDNIVHVAPPVAPGSAAGREYSDRTAVFTSEAYVVDPSLPQAQSAADVFVQQDFNAIGLHVDTLHRGPNSLSSVNPLYQLHNSKGPGLRDDRFFPFGAYESDVKLSISFELNVRRLNVRSAGGAAYGHPTLEFVDTTSGHHVYFTILTYGTVPTDDFLAVDAGTGKVIVGTSFGPNASYGHSFGDKVLPLPLQYDQPDQTLANHGNFAFQMTRDDFRKVLADARRLDAAISAEPADYLLDNFHFNNEVFGDGEIGLWLTNYTVMLFRR